MSREENVVGNFHESSSGSHPAESIGNQQIWGPAGYQVGAIEYIPDPVNVSLNLVVTNTDGEVVSDL